MISLKFRIFITGLILMVDILIVPYLFQIPFFVKQNGFVDGLAYWSSQLIQEPLGGAMSLMTDTKLRSAWLPLQVAILVLIISVWTYGRRKSFWGKSELKTAGSGQHGTARWRTPKEIEKTMTIWKIPV